MSGKTAADIRQLFLLPGKLKVSMPCPLDVVLKYDLPLIILVRL
ncbi:hypothetical protein DFR59_12810 [Falsibacillus pallidus]|uniref:Uncharacterized protein n=1 Tax=Falsibacillus pallidus TaxID=493781 RepID=A0A370G1Y8_9BACI|nr:hypothetical protein DFR59_12810 [Falsibacillus pallidus]